MSRHSSRPTWRGFSDNSWTGKRSAEDRGQNMLSGSSKRARRNIDEEEIGESIVVATGNESELTQVVDDGRPKSEDFRIIIPEDTLVVDPKDHTSRIGSEDAAWKAREAFGEIHSQDAEQPSGQRGTDPKPTLISTSQVAHTSTAAITNTSRTQECPPPGNDLPPSSPEIRVTTATPQVSASTQAPLHQPPPPTPGGRWPAQLNRAPVLRVLPAQKHCRRPQVFFTIDNQAKSELSSTELQSLIEIFTENTRVLLPPIISSSYPHPVGVIMWQTLPDFCTWYTRATGSLYATTGVLKFQLITFDIQPENTFLVRLSDFDDFRRLKQFIWDLFWDSMNLSSEAKTFRVVISAVAYEDPASESSNNPRWNAINSRRTKLPSKMSKTHLENITIVPSSRATTSSPSTSHPGDSLPCPTGLPPLSPPDSTQQAPSPLPALVTHDHTNNDTTPIMPQIRNSLLRADVPSTHPPAGSPPKPPGDHLPTPSTAFTQRAKVRVSNPNYISNSVSEHSRSIEVPYGRAALHKAGLREWAQQLIGHREDLELEDDESTAGDKPPHKTGAEVCGAVIDRYSGKGSVTITSNGFIILTVTTGPDQQCLRYQEIVIHNEHTCKIGGEAVVLYYKFRKIAPPFIREHALEPENLPLTSPSQELSSKPTASSSVAPRPIPPFPSKSTADIIIRLQTDATGKFGPPLDKFTLRRQVTTLDFFAWFASQTGHTGPDGPPLLRFTFKDAMPTAKVSNIAKGNEDHFNYMRKDIKVQCDRAVLFMPGLKEFVILVTVPQWIEEEEEEW